MRALIIDDEPIARRVLREELELFKGVEIVGESENGHQAAIQIRSLRPDLIFLDIQMPGMSGFELLNSLQGGHFPAVIMVTAFDQHAIRAFEAGAVDYLLKPVHGHRLEQALERARKTIGNPAQRAAKVAHLQELLPAPSGSSVKLRKIVGKLGDEYFILSLRDVLAFQADGDCVWIITVKQRYLASQNLRIIQERLGNSSFLRIHRNALVNIEHVSKLSALSSQRWLVTLNNGQEFVVSKRQVKSVQDLLHW